MPVATFSVVGRDESTGDLGVAVASRFPAVGAVVPWIEIGVGAVAVQALPGPAFGSRLLRALTAGRSPEQAIADVLADDPDRGTRQIGIVDADGRAATYTGERCDAWAGGVTGPGCAAQGNILVGSDVVDAMSRVYLASRDSLPERLLAALAAGQDAGGDRRGQQSAALLVLRFGGGYLRSSDRYVDLRVDDDPNPIPELRRLLGMHRLLFSPPREQDLRPLDSRLVRRLQGLLVRTGDLQTDTSGEYDEATRRALRYRFGCENLEERWRDDELIDSVAISYLMERYPQE